MAVWLKQMYISPLSPVNSIFFSFYKSLYTNFITYTLINRFSFLQNDSTTEDDDDGDDDDDEEVVTILPEDKYRVGSLEKMISVMAVLVEESRIERYCSSSLFNVVSVVGHFPSLPSSISSFCLFQKS